MFAFRRQTRGTLFLAASAGVLILAQMNRMTTAGSPSPETASEPFSPDTILSSQTKAAPSPARATASQPPSGTDFLSNPKANMAYLDGLVERTGGNYGSLTQKEKDWLNTTSHGNAERVFRSKTEEFRMNAAFEARKAAPGAVGDSTRIAR